MTASLAPYLNFRGQAAAALTFYASVFDGEASSSTFADFGGMGVPESEQGNVMHGQLEGPGITLMCSDVPSHMALAPSGGFSVSLFGDDDAVLRRWWERLTDGATITEELRIAPWGDAFGMLTDKFGISWLVNITGAVASADE